MAFEKRFDEEYKPMLQVFISERTEELARRKWWTAIYDEQKKRSVLIVTGFIGVALFVGAGAAVLYLIKQINAFLSQALSGLFS